TPYCVTVDVQTVGDSAKGEVGDGRVTIRDRDSMGQVRVPIAELETVLERLLGGAPWADVAEGLPRSTPGGGGAGWGVWGGREPASRIAPVRRWRRAPAW